MAIRLLYFPTRIRKMTMRQAARGGSNALGMAVASLLLLGAWWASSETCVGLQCMPVSVVAAMSSDTPLPASAAGSDGLSQVSQSGSLLLLGSAFALTARLLKRQKYS